MELSFVIKNDKINFHVGTNSDDSTNLMIKMLISGDSMLAKALVKENLREIQRILEPYENIQFSIDNSIIQSNLNEMGRKKLLSEYKIKTIKQLPDEIVSNIMGYNAPGLGKFISHEHKRRNKNENLTLDDIVKQDLIEYFYNQIPHDNLCEIAAKYGKIETLEWLRSQDPPCPWDENTCVAAAKYGHLETLKWLISQGCIWDYLTYSSAAENGHIEILEWLMDYEKANPESDNFSEPDFLYSNISRYAAKGGQIKTLMWIKSKDPHRPWDIETCSNAASQGQIGTLMWLRSQNPPCPWDETTCSAAAYNGKIETLEWLRSQNPPCPWSEETCMLAAENGQIETLEWLRLNGCPWDATSYYSPASVGNLEMLIWLRSHNCPWNEGVCYEAAANGQVATVMWLRSQNPPCPWNKTECIGELEGNDIDIPDILLGDNR
jgi:hypothetical protein